MLFPKAFADALEHAKGAVQFLGFRDSPCELSLPSHFTAIAKSSILHIEDTENAQMKDRRNETRGTTR